MTGIYKMAPVSSWDARLVSKTLYGKKEDFWPAMGVFLHKKEESNISATWQIIFYISEHFVKLKQLDMLYGAILCK